MYDKIRGEVKQFPYRTAQVVDVFLELPRKACHDLEEQLAAAARKRPDNHTTYELKQRGWGSNGPQDNITYISCSDFTVRFGRQIIEKPW
jgi:hypothetical protein